MMGAFGSGAGAAGARGVDAATDGALGPGGAAQLLKSSSETAAVESAIRR
jgi:hypothetical protein